MKSVQIFISTVVLAALLPATGAIHEKKPASTSFSPGVFEGTSPGAAIARPFLQIPVNDPCDYIKWKLTLNNDPGVKESGTFILDREYGYYVDNRTDASKGKISIAGKWELIRGAQSKTGAEVYRLHSGQNSICFQKLNDNLLHLLDADQSLMTGNSAQSFTLSRTDSTLPSTSILKNVRKTASEPGHATDTVMAFTGRTPCKAIAKELQMTTSHDCFKIKWLLTFYRDPKTLQPTRYELKRTLHRQSVIEGKWQIIKGMKADAGVIIYQLDPDQPAHSLFLLKGDDNVLFFLDRQWNLLVGNADFSYTLNRKIPRR